MATYGLVGNPLGHSFSKAYFENKFREEQLKNHSYLLFPMEQVEELTDLLAKHPDLKGFNVTIPHKQSIMPLLDEIDTAARVIGAVNTVKIKGVGATKKLVGYNTDVWGFKSSLLHLLAGVAPRKALILGNGGAAKSVAFVMNELEMDHLIVSRTKGESTITYDQLTKEIMANHTLIINTTPLGMFPNTEAFPPILYEYLGADHLLYDLVYNPDETTFMAKGKAMGCRTVNGLQMLHLQADKAWEIWNDNDR